MKTLRPAAVLVALVLGCGTSAAPEAASPVPAGDAPSATPESMSTPSASSSAPASAQEAAPQSGELIGVPIANKPKPAGPGSSEADAGQSVELVYVESKAQKPHKRLLFDVTLRNQRNEPRWFVLPAVVHPQDKMIKSGVDGVEVFALQGDARVVMGRFTGKGAFHAVLLPPSAEVKVKRLPIDCSYPSLKECAVPIEVVIAGKLAIGGEAAETWLGDKPTSDARGEVTHEGGAKRTSGKKAGGTKEVTLEDPKRVKLTLVLGAS